jgi:hypothetical protein
VQYLKKTFFTVYFSLLLTGAVAQPGDPCPNPPCDPDVPISGIEILLLTGGALGVGKLLQQRKKSG